MTVKYGIEFLVNALANDTRHAALYVDAKGIIQSWNLGAESFFGHSPDIAIGKRADIIVPSEQHEIHWQGFNRAIASDWSGSHEWGPIEPIHKEGHLVSLEVFLFPIRHSLQDKIIGIVALFRKPIKTT